MKLTGAVVLFGAALLLASGGDCGICSSKRKKNLFFRDPSLSEYIVFVSKYSSNPAKLKNAENLKKCLGTKFIEEDKVNVQSLLKKLEANPFCW